MPSSRASAAVASEVGTPATRRPDCTALPRAWTNAVAAWPVPSPMFWPALTKPNACAASAAASLSVSVPVMPWDATPDRARRPVSGARGHAGGEENQLIPARALGVVHRRVGIEQEGLHVARVVGTDADPDAGADVELMRPDLERPRQLLQHLLADHAGIEPAGQLGQHHDELVATDPRHRVLAPHAGLHPLTDDFE